MDCIRKLSLRTQSSTLSSAEARCAKSCAYVFCIHPKAETPSRLYRFMANKLPGRDRLISNRRSAHDAVPTPSIVTGFPMSAIEALTTGARVVCARVKNLIVLQRLPYIYSSKRSFVSAGQNTLTKAH
jgi:hypothetical protein